MRGVDDDRQMRQLLEAQGAAEVEDVARVRIEAAVPRSHSTTRRLPSSRMYSAAPKSSSSVAAGPRLSRIGSPVRAAAHSSRDVLHVARADLEHVGEGRDQRDVRLRQRLDHDGEPRPPARFGDQRERLVAQPLEVVRRGARLVGAAAQHRPARVAHGQGRRPDLRLALDRGRSPDQGESTASKAGAAHLEGGRGLRGSLGETIRIRHVVPRDRFSRSGIKKATR